MRQEISRRKLLLGVIAGIGVLPVAGAAYFAFQRIFNRPSSLLISTASTDAAWSPDSTRVASAGLDGSVHVWNAPTGETLLTCTLELTGSEVYPLNVVWSTDGMSLLAFFGEYPGGNDSGVTRMNLVQIWDAATGQRLRSVPILPDAMKPASSVSRNSLALGAWALNERYLAVATGKDYQELEIWNIATGNKVSTPNATTMFSPVIEMLWAPQGTKLVVVRLVSTNIYLELWDISTGKITHTFGLASQADEVIACSFDGKVLALGTTIRNEETGRTITTYQGQGRLISQAWAPDGKHLAANFLTSAHPYGPMYSTIYFIDASSGEQVAISYEGEIDPLDNMTTSSRKMVWSPNGKNLLVVRSTRIEIWKAETA